MCHNVLRCVPPPLSIFPSLHLTVTQPTPVSLALSMARHIAKLPTTAPRLEEGGREVMMMMVMMMTLMTMTIITMMRKTIMKMTMTMMTMEMMTMTVRIMTVITTMSMMVVMMTYCFHPLERWRKSP